MTKQKLTFMPVFIFKMFSFFFEIRNYVIPPTPHAQSPLDISPSLDLFFFSCCYTHTDM